MNVRQELPKAFRRAPMGFFLIDSFVVCMFLVTFFSETDTPSFSHDRDPWLILKLNYFFNGKVVFKVSTFHYKNIYVWNQNKIRAKEVYI